MTHTRGGRVLNSDALALARLFPAAVYADSERTGGLKAVAATGTVPLGPLKLSWCAGPLAAPTLHLLSAKSNLVVNLRRQN